MFTPQYLLIALAVFVLIVMLPALANPKKFRKALKTLLTDENTIRISGFLSLLVALIFLSVNWRFQNDWIISISILGWAAFLKGIVMIWNPNYIKKMVKRCKLYNTDTGVAILSILGVVLAALLIYLGTELVTLGEIVSG